MFGVDHAVLRSLGAAFRSRSQQAVRASVVSRHCLETLILANSGCATAPNSADIRDSAGSFGAFPLSAGSKDSAILTDLPAGAYTVRVTSADGTPGVALIEFYAGER